MMNKEDIKELIENMKVKQKEIALETGQNERSVRRMKAETPEKYELILDALKYRKAIGQLDMKLIKENNIYNVYVEKKILLGFDCIDWLKLNDIEKKNLERVNETTLRECVQDLINKKALFL